MHGSKPKVQSAFCLSYHVKDTKYISPHGRKPKEQSPFRFMVASQRYVVHFVPWLQAKDTKSISFHGSKPNILSLFGLFRFMVASQIYFKSIWFHGSKQQILSLFRSMQASQIY